MRQDKDQLDGLDRKSSRGMLYENEELRLKTININAEVESRQSDIKKLKKENEMLKKGLWYLRDEYDKLERLIKEKNIGFSSPSTCSTSNDSESCSSCSEEAESDEVETEQNLQNVQRTNLRNIHEKFEQLSVVTEETSAENSEHSTQKEPSPVGHWNDFENHVIQPDQSYPIYSNIDKNKTLPTEDKMRYFSPIDPQNNFETNNYNQIRSEMVYPDYFNNSQFTNNSSSIPNVQIGDQIEKTDNPDVFNETFQQSRGNNFLSQTNIQSDSNNFYQNIVLMPPDSQPLPEITAVQKSLTDLIVKIDNQNFNKDFVYSNTPSQSTFSTGGNLEELLNDIESVSLRNARNQVIPQNEGISSIGEITTQTQAPTHQKVDSESSGDKAYTSELNVVLLPNPMPLITFDKYKNVQRSFENLHSKPLEVSASQEELGLAPPPPLLPKSRSAEALKIQSAPVMALNTASTDKETNPFFFGNFKDNYVDGNFFNRYNPNNFVEKEDDKKSNIGSKDKLFDGSKSNLRDTTVPEHTSNEQDNNGKFNGTTLTETKNNSQSKENVKSPSLSLRKKVSIHFKGKSKKLNNLNSDSSIPNSANNEKKHSIFDVKFLDKDKNKGNHQKTPSIESRKSTTETSYNQEPKTTSSSESKHSNEKKTTGSRKEFMNDKKLRKSHSVSPDRGKHHIIEDGLSKKHKKHKRGDRSRLIRPSVTIEPRTLRERSFSVCTDRSIPLDYRLGLGIGFGSSFIADDHSDRERTNSFSSCDTAEHARKMSSFSNVHLSEKVPWCGCWGNGCL